MSYEAFWKDPEFQPEQFKKRCRRCAQIGWAAALAEFKKINQPPQRIVELAMQDGYTVGYEEGKKSCPSAPQVQRQQYFAPPRPIYHPPPMAPAPYPRQFFPGYANGYQPPMHQTPYGNSLFQTPENTFPEGLMGPSRNPYSGF